MQNVVLTKGDRELLHKIERANRNLFQIMLYGDGSEPKHLGTIEAKTSATHPVRVAAVRRDGFRFLLTGAAKRRARNKGKTGTTNQTNLTNHSRSEAALPPPSAFV